MCKSIYLSTHGEMSSGGLINFGYFKDASYTFLEIIIFILFGIIGGLLGALWNYLNCLLTKFRMVYITSKLTKFLEVLMVSVVVTSCAFICMCAIKDCKEFDNQMQYGKYVVVLNCEEGKFHAGAALWFETPENSVKDMFHSAMYTYNPSSLAAFFTVYFVISFITYGISISSGLFIPSLLIGTAWGRLLGMHMIEFFPNYNFGDVGKFSLMGASAQLSGIVRLTVSLCVILIESTGGMTYAFPILIVVIVSKAVGDIFNHGIYDMHLDLAGVPILDWRPPVNALILRAKDIMASPVVCLTMRSKMSKIQKVMQETNHSAFPIVDDAEATDDVIGELQQQRSYGKLRGIVLRTDILTMICHNMFENGSRTPESWDFFLAMYPSYVHTDSVCYNLPFQQRAVLDFRNIMNPAPQTCNPSLGFDRVYHQFRKSGARHIVVVNDCNEVIGMITRKDLNRPVPIGKCGQYHELKAKSMVVACKPNEAFQQAATSFA